MNKHLYNDPTIKSSRRCPKKNATGAEQKFGQRRDANRDSYLRELNIRMVRFWNNAVFHNPSLSPLILRGDYWRN